RQNDRYDVRTRKTGIDSELAGIKAARFSEEETREIEQMGSHVMHGEVWLSKKISLVFEEPDVAMAKLNMSAERSADDAGSKQLLDATHGGLPAVVFMNEEWRARFQACSHHGLACGIIHRHWFLADDGQAA